jgi:L-lactate dehydrogenase (cytochrome)
MRELRNVTCIEDLRTIARRKVPRASFDYAEAGSYSEQTLRTNRAGLEALNLRQRVLIDVSARETATTILGQPVSAPTALGPVAMTGLEHGNGEILACRAAHEAGIPFTRSKT